MFGYMTNAELIREAETYLRVGPPVDPTLEAIVLALIARLEERTNADD